MKQYILPTLAATLILFSACAKQPNTPEEPVVDPTLPKMTINGHIESMTGIAFEWKPLKDSRVKGYYVYRNSPGVDEEKLHRIQTIEGRYVSHFTDNGLKPNTTYAYRFSSFNAKMQESDASKTFRVTTKPVLDSVSFFDSIGNLPRMAKLIWRPHDNPSVKEYILERQILEKADWEQIATIENRLQAEYIDRNLDDNRVYKYRLRAVTYDGIESTPSDIAKVNTKPLPKTVQDLFATTKEPRKILLSWTANTEKDLDFYNIYRSTSGDGSYDYYVKLNETNFVDEINEDGQNYYYKVTAVDKDGLESPMQSNPVHGSTLAKPHTPSFIDAIVKNNTAVLRWKNNDPRTQNYTLIKTTHEGWLNTTTQEITGIKGTSFTAKDLLPDIKYQFQIMSVDINNINSEPSEAVDVLFSTPDQ